MEDTTKVAIRCQCGLEMKHVEKIKKGPVRTSGRFSYRGAFTRQSGYITTYDQCPNFKDHPIEGVKNWKKIFVTTY